MRRHYSSRIWLVVFQHSHRCCIAQQIFTKSSFQLCKGVSLLHLYWLGGEQDESDRRIWKLLHSCLFLFLAYWYFTCLASSLRGKTTKGKAHPEMQIPNILISKTRTISTLQISNKMENFVRQGRKRKKKNKELWCQWWWSSFPYYSSQLSKMRSLRIDLSRSAQVMTSPGSSFLNSSDVGQWPSDDSSSEDRQCFQADTLHALCPLRFQCTHMLSKFSKHSNYGVSKASHSSMCPKLFPV